MFAIVVAVQVLQAPVTVTPRPMLGATTIRTLSPMVRKQQMMSQGRTMLARAEAVQAGYVPAAGQPTKAELQNQIDQMKSDLDSMSEMGEMESLRLQMAMDRMSKMMSTLSNLLEKISDTQDAIVQNLK